MIISNSSLFFMKGKICMSLKKKIITGITLSSTSALIIHIINKFIYYSASLDNLLDNPSGTYYDWKFGKIYYKKTGNGYPLLLIHDLNTFSSGHEWNRVLKQLSKTNTVYRIDLLGCGRSDKPNLTYTNYLYAQLISDFIKRVIGQKTNVIATGESGSFVISACNNDDSIIKKIILINPTDIKELSRIPTKRIKISTNLISTPIIGTFLYNILTRKTMIENLFEECYFYDKNNIEDELIQTYYEAAHMGNGSPRYLFASLNGHYTTMNLNHCLKSLTNSIYIIIGKETDENIEIAGTYQKILPSIEVDTIEKTKLLPQLEKPQEFMNQIEIFLDDEC